MAGALIVARAGVGEIRGVGVIWWIIGGALLWRGVLAALMPLGTDEAYALAVGRGFDLSFFDHPPLGFWAPALMEALGARSEFLFRLPHLVLGGVTMWLLYLTGRRLGGEVAGLWTAGLAALAPFISYSGLIILPDGPLSAGLALMIYCLIRLVQGEEARLALWLWAGLGLGVALASKYQAGLAGLTILLWLAVSPAYWGWLRRQGFYRALVLSVLGLAPVVAWNIAHDWASFAFHGGRAGGGLDLRNFAIMVAAQAVYLSPVVFLWALRVITLRPLWAQPETRLLLMLGLAPILMFNAIYLFSRGTLPHWTMPGYLALLPLMGLMLARGAWPRARFWMLGLALPLHLAVVALALHARTGVMTAPVAVLPDWDQTSPLIPLSETRTALEQSGFLEGVGFLAATDWIPAGHIAAAMGPDWPMRVLGHRPHHFQFLPQPAEGQAGLLLGIVQLGTQEAEAARLSALAEGAGYDVQDLGYVVVNRGARPYFALPALLLTTP